MLLSQIEQAIDQLLQRHPLGSKPLLDVESARQAVGRQRQNEVSQIVTSTFAAGVVGIVALFLHLATGNVWVGVDRMLLQIGAPAAVWALLAYIRFHALNTGTTMFTPVIAKACPEVSGHPVVLLVEDREHAEAFTSDLSTNGLLAEVVPIRSERLWTCRGRRRLLVGRGWNPSVCAITELHGWQLAGVVVPDDDFGAGEDDPDRAGSDRSTGAVPDSV
jgi:hypothetical protein